jgi:FAD:protein FMN transferase
MRHPFPPGPDPSAGSSSSRRLRIALGTWVAIEARVPGRAEAAEVAAIEAAYTAIRDIDLRMHPHRVGSEIARINSTPPGTPIEVQADTWRLLQLARRLFDLSERIFDPCLPTHPGRLGDIEIQPNAPVLTCHAPVEIDLGGIAKGHAIDRAVQKLQELGCACGLVNAGGDLRIFGDHAETFFLRRGTGGDTLILKNAALAVSDVDATDRPSEHRGYYARGHELDATLPRYAAVIANTAAVADALTKCVLLCSKDAATRILQEFGAHSAP